MNTSIKSIHKELSKVGRITTVYDGKTGKWKAKLQAKDLTLVGFACPTVLEAMERLQRSYDGHSRGITEFLEVSEKRE